MEKQKKERKKERHGKAENQAGTSPQGLFKKTGLSWTLPGTVSCSTDASGWKSLMFSPILYHPYANSLL